jgi:hypothetical protein
MHNSSKMLAQLTSVRWRMSRPLLRYLSLAAIFLLGVLTLVYNPDSRDYLRPSRYTTGPAVIDYFKKLTKAQPHPIDTLIAQALEEHDRLLEQASYDVGTAAARYRARRGRHPPPGFDKWMQYAMYLNATIVENYFDRIYHDIAPFWALDPKTTALRAAAAEFHVQVRGGVAEGIGNVEGRVPWLQLWTGLVSEMAAYLPDVDMPVNMMDESRIIVEWENIDKYLRAEAKSRKIPAAKDMTSEWSGLQNADGAKGEPYQPKWIHEGPLHWDVARAGCPAGSPSRGAAALYDFEMAPAFPHDWSPSFSYAGYVKNYTASSDICIQPHLRALHGTFIEPLTMATTKELIPLFGGSKLQVNNEILIPGAMYLTNDSFYSGGDAHGPPWRLKDTGLIWRGDASGGRHKKENWQHFQRLRLIEMLNGTTVGYLEHNHARGHTFELPSAERYDVSHLRKGDMGKWLDKFADVGFVHLVCFPREVNCSYLSEYFHEVEGKPMVEQYQKKFIPDVDGNSFSARFRGLLLSTSLPIKATIYAEWHDYRLVPWLHFVPFDNTFQDLYGILDYFTRDKKGDAAARLIAETGKEWGEKALRREDMMLYVWRLLLEFARVCDVKRDKLGYVADLIAEKPEV